MKKVKITVIRKDFNRELAKEYGVDMITPCTRSMPEHRGPKACAMEHGVQSTNMYLH
jgi:hypothetical protein